jgi:hypothetical protein
MAARVTLVHPEAKCELPLDLVNTKCTFFQVVPFFLLGTSYTVRSPVPLAVFRQFTSAVEGKPVEITEANYSGLFQLSDELGFEGLGAQLSQFQFQSSNGTAPDRRPGRFSSVIISEFPGIFEDFGSKNFGLLWRGSYDGFRASVFHARCDGHKNTLTVILDQYGNIFGGFSAPAWESRRWNFRMGDGNNCSKADESKTSFLFTLKNPHNIPPRKFPLRPDMSRCAIQCNELYGPTFQDICVMSGANIHAGSNTGLGLVYVNDTGLDGGLVFNGSSSFNVAEIEVFEVTD